MILVVFEPTPSKAMQSVLFYFLRPQHVVEMVV